MKTILISPFSKKMRNKEENPKNFPYWKDVVNLLRADGFKVVQVGVQGEKSIGADEQKFNLSLKDLRKLLVECDAWISVDNFFNHFATFYGKRGVVIFSRSDPLIFGYPQNINLLKGREYLRKDQFNFWEQDKFNADAFVSASEVVSAVKIVLSQGMSRELISSISAAL